MSDDNFQAIQQAIQSILERLDRNDEEIKANIKTLSTELSQTQKWNDRTWDVIKWVGGISAGLSISAAIALVGLLIRLSK